VYEGDSKQIALDHYQSTTTSNITDRSTLSAPLVGLLAAL